MVSITDINIVKKNNVQYNPFQVGINKPDYMNVPMTSNQDLPLVDEFESSRPKQENKQEIRQAKQETETKDKEHSWVDTTIDVVGDVGAGIVGTFLGPIGGAIVGAGLKAGIGFISAKA